MDPEPSRNWSAGHELAPGLLAWALLGDSRRCETWLAWDVGRWCPVAVKLRPGRETARAVAALLAPDPAGRPVSAAQVLALLAAAMPADAGEEDRPWPAWATGRLDGWQASAMERPPLAPRSA